MNKAVMVVGNEQVYTKIETEGIEIEQARTFQYLGVRIDGKGSQEAEINQKTNKKQQSCTIVYEIISLTNKKIYCKTKLKHIRQYTDRYQSTYCET